MLLYIGKLRFKTLGVQYDNNLIEPFQALPI